MKDGVCVSKMVCDKVVCERYCVTKSCAKDGVCVCVTMLRVTSRVCVCVAKMVCNKDVSETWCVTKLGV